MSVGARLYVGNAVDVLRTLPDGSVRCCVTSPPYWGLRDYGTPPQIWGGDPEHVHQWGAEGRIHKGGPHGEKGALCGGSRAVVEAQAAVKDFQSGAFCPCGAWRGHLGLEPTPELYIEHMVSVFREVRRVLAQDGTLWLNIGDCYATGAGKVGEHPGGGEQGARWAGDVNRVRDARRGYRADRLVNTNGGDTVRPKTRATRDGTHAGKHTAIAAMGPMTQPNRMPLPGLKPKDLVMMPARLALALQADGWWIRRDIIWSKPNPMPESVRDRPTTSHEYVFQLTKSQRYYYDAVAISEPLQSGPSDLRKMQEGLDRITPNEGDVLYKANPSTRIGRKRGVGGQAKRRSGNKQRDIPSADDGRGIPDNHRGRGIPWEDDGAGRNARSVWTIATVPYPGAHFATFPPELARRCILAGSAPGDTVLDPFGGSGTTAAVAVGHGRSAIYIDLSPAYLELARHRIGPILCEAIA